MTAVHLYPYSQSENPPQNKFLTPRGKVWSQTPPREMTDWERMAAILNKETGYLLRDNFANDKPHATQLSLTLSS